MRRWAASASQIGQFVERCRAQEAVREADARKSAILNAAFDCVVTMDHRGHIVEVNQATERTFGYSAEEMIGQELAALMIPPDLRDAHRKALIRYIDTGQSRMINHPVELRGMRKDGSEFPVELAVTRPQLPGPPLFCGYLRDVTERRKAEEALRRLAAEQAALRRVATAVAARDATRPTCSALVTEEVGPAARCADREHGPLRQRRVRATVVGGWSAARRQERPGRRTRRARRRHRAARVWRTGAPARVDSYDDMEGALAAHAARASASAPPSPRR